MYSYRVSYQNFLMHVVICSYAVHFAYLIIHGLVVNSIGEENKF